jgi:hypothetical protein
MPSKFDEYLNKGGFTEADREAVEVKEAKEATPETVGEDYQAREGKPLDSNVHGYDEGKETEPLSEEAKGQASEVAAPEEPKEGVEADYPSSQSRGEEPAVENEAENEQEEEL